MTMLSISVSRCPWLSKGLASIARTRDLTPDFFAATRSCIGAPLSIVVHACPCLTGPSPCMRASSTIVADTETDVDLAAAHPLAARGDGARPTPSERM